MTAVPGLKAALSCPPSRWERTLLLHLDLCGAGVLNPACTSEPREELVQTTSPTSESRAGLSVSRGAANLRF